MPVFNLKHAFFSGAGAAVGAIGGYLLGIVLYVVLLASSAFVNANSVAASAIQGFTASAGIFPLIFAVAFGAMGFFGGYYLSLKSEEEGKAASA